MKMSVGRSDPPPKDKKWGEGEEGGKGKEVQKIKSYSDVMKMKLDKYEFFFLIASEFRFLSLESSWTLTCNTLIISG